MLYFAVDNLCATNHDAKEETHVFYDDVHLCGCVFELVSEGLRSFVMAALRSRCGHYIFAL